MVDSYVLRTLINFAYSQTWLFVAQLSYSYHSPKVTKVFSLFSLIHVLSTVRTGLEGPGLTAAQKMWYCIATVGGQYIWTRLQSFSAFRRWGDSEQVFVLFYHIWICYYALRINDCFSFFWIILSFQRTFGQRAWLLLQHVEGFYKAASFSNLLLFLLTEK